MYAVIDSLQFRIPVEQLVPALQQTGLPLLSCMPGFLDFLLVRVAEDRAIAIVFWQSARDAEDAARVFGLTWFSTHFAPFLADEQHGSGEIIVQYEH